MAWKDVLLGAPIRDDAVDGAKTGWAEGAPVRGLDALASSARGPEAALTVLRLGGAAGAGIPEWFVP